MGVQRGLDGVTFSGGGNSLEWFKINEGETKTIRFLTEGSEIISLPKHFVKVGKFKGNIMCLNNPEENKFDCPLCRNAGKEFGSPISTATERCYAVIIDRETGEPKILEGTKGVYNQLSEIYKTNKSITNVDYSFSKKKGSSKWIDYKLNALITTARPLTKEEKELGAKMNLEDVISAFSKTHAEVKKILEGKAEEKHITKKNIEVEGDLNASLESIAESDDLFED